MNIPDMPNYSNLIFTTLFFGYKNFCQVVKDFYGVTKIFFFGGGPGSKTKHKKKRKRNFYGLIFSQKKTMFLNVYGTNRGDFALRM